MWAVNCRHGNVKLNLMGVTVSNKRHLAGRE